MNCEENDSGERGGFTQLTSSVYSALDRKRNLRNNYLGAKSAGLGNQIDPVRYRSHYIKARI